MAKRIGLLGGESTGKTSLAASLAAALPACVVDEQLRAFVARHGRTPLQSEQAAVMQAQIDAEDAVAARCPHPVVVADPSPLMTAVYSEVYFGDRSLTASAVEQAARADLLVWCADDIPWTADPGQRDGADLRRAADTVIARIVADDLAPRGSRVIRVTGSLADRTEAVLQAWRSVGPAGPT